MGRGGLVMLLISSAAWAACATAQTAEPAAATATATLRDTEGNEVGRATLTQGAKGVVIAATLTGVPDGVHAMHVHAVGACEPPFDSAGGHAKSEGKAHGILAAGGMHEGDLPNAHVAGPEGLEVEAFAVGATLGAGGDGRLPLLDADGSAIVLHAGADDYATDPAGGAGARIACGVITP